MARGVRAVRVLTQSLLSAAALLRGRLCRTSEGMAAQLYRLPVTRLHHAPQLRVRQPRHIDGVLLPYPPLVNVDAALDQLDEENDLPPADNVSRVPPVGRNEVPSSESHSGRATRARAWLASQAAALTATVRNSSGEPKTRSSARHLPVTALTTIESTRVSSSATPSMSPRTPAVASEPSTPSTAATRPRNLADIRIS